MNNSFVNNARRLLINVGKMLPFAICFVVLISYIESLFALLTENFLWYDGSVSLNTPISFFIADKFEYDYLSVFITFIISIATQTCKWNRISVGYLFIHLLFKHYIGQIELTEITISVLCTLNIIITSFLVYKGITKL